MKLLLMFLFFLPCFAVEQNPRIQEQGNLTIVDVMTLDPTFSSFITALNVANLTYVLENNSGFTVFAPTNDAFDALSRHIWKDLLRPENISKLQTILKYHILPESIAFKEFKDEELKTLNGKEVRIKLDSGEILVNHGKIVVPNKRGTNGIVHGIDTVLFSH